MKVRTYKSDDRVIHVTDPLYGYLNDFACVRQDLHGDSWAFYGKSRQIIACQDIGNGWTRYWTIGNDSEIKRTEVMLAQVLIQFNETR